MHLRYALRRKGEGVNNYDAPLPSESISLMLGLVAEMVRNEREDLRLANDLKHKSKISRVTIFAAMGAALLSSLTALSIALIKLT